MCNKCLNYHKELFESHQLNDLNNNSNEIFIDICKENNHGKKLEFYCKSHNKLCCVDCISKLKEKGYGQHKDCDVYLIENIKEEKKNKLNENIKYLEEVSKNFENIIKKLKLKYEKIKKN